MKKLATALALLLVACSLAPSAAINAFDLSVFEGEVNCFQCIKNAGFDLMIIEIYSSTKQFNQYLAQNIRAAVAANISIDVYIFPDINRTAQDQITQFLGYMKNNSLPYNKVWLDVENTALWFPTPQQNQQFLAELVNYCLLYVQPANVGIYASNAQWQPIMNGTRVFQEYPLWWARWDNQTNFDSYAPFGGWELP